jgi:hypothetical protein
LGRPVSFEGPKPLTFNLVNTVFGSKTEVAHSFGDKRSIRLTCRAGTLKRAFTNLINNALKYGHRAYVSLDATADEVIVIRYFYHFIGSKVLARAVPVAAGWGYRLLKRLLMLMKGK